MRAVTGKAVSQLREKGLIPAVMYGKGQKPLSLEVPEQAFLKVFRVAGESTLIDLAVDGKKHKVLVQDVARDPLSDKIIHADFHGVADRKIAHQDPAGVHRRIQSGQEFGRRIDQER